MKPIMKTNRHPSTSLAPLLPKCLTGIQGLDEITGGGLPRGRPTLVCGRARCGKTLLAAEFLLRGAAHLGEAGLPAELDWNGAECRGERALLAVESLQP